MPIINSWDYDTYSNPYRQQSLLTLFLSLLKKYSMKIQNYHHFFNPYYNFNIFNFIYLNLIIIIELQNNPMKQLKYIDTYDNNNIQKNKLVDNISSQSNYNQQKFTSFKIKKISYGGQYDNMKNNQKIIIDQDLIDEQEYEKLNAKLECQNIDEWADNLKQSKIDQLNDIQLTTEQYHQNKEIQDMKHIFYNIQMQTINTELNQNQMPELNQLIVNQCNQNIKNSMKNKQKSTEISSQNIQDKFKLLNTQQQNLITIETFKKTTNDKILNTIFQSKLDKKIQDINLQKPKMNKDVYNKVKSKIIREQQLQFSQIRYSFKNLIDFKSGNLQQFTQKQENLSSKNLDDLKIQLQKFQQNEYYFQYVDDKLQQYFNNTNKQFLALKKQIKEISIQLFSKQTTLYSLQNIFQQKKQKYQDELYDKEIQQDKNLKILQIYNKTQKRNSFLLHKIEINDEQLRNLKQQYDSQSHDLQKQIQNLQNQIKEHQVLIEDLNNNFQQYKIQKNILLCKLRDHYQNKLNNDSRLKNESLMWVIKNLKDMGEEEIKKFKFPEHINKQHIEFLLKLSDLEDQILSIKKNPIYVFNSYQNTPQQSIHQQYCQKQFESEQNQQLNAKEELEKYKLSVKKNSINVFNSHQKSPQQSIHQQYCQKQFESEQNQQLNAKEVLEKQKLNIAQFKQNIEKRSQTSQNNSNIVKIKEKQLETSILQGQIEQFKLNQFNLLYLEYINEIDHSKIKNFEKIFISLFGFQETQNYLAIFNKKRQEYKPIPLQIQNKVTQNKLKIDLDKFVKNLPQIDKQQEGYNKMIIKDQLNRLKSESVKSLIKTDRESNFKSSYHQSDEQNFKSVSNSQSQANLFKHKHQNTLF